MYSLFWSGKHNLTKTYIINMAVGLLVVLTVAGFGTIASAQVTTGPASSTIEQQRQVLEERREAIVASTTSTDTNTQTSQTTQSTQRAVLDERAQQRLTNLAALLSNRMETTIRRLENITGRLDSRITKIEASGTDTTNARAELAAAKESLAVATSLLTKIDTQIHAFVTSEDPQTAWFSVRETYLSAKSAILNAHQHLRTCITLLKNPTPTVTNTNQTDV